MLPEMLVLLGPVALVPYATPGTEQLAEQLKLYLQDHDGFLLENHGALTVGSDLREAALRMELVEHNAQITMLVRQIGKPFVLSPERDGVPDGDPSKDESRGTNFSLDSAGQHQPGLITPETWETRAFLPEVLSQSSRLRW